MSEKTDPVEDLVLLVRSRHGLLWVDTDEEERAESLLRQAAGRVGLAYFIWTPSKGLYRDGERQHIYGTTSLVSALEHVEHTPLPTVYCFHGVTGQFNEMMAASKLKDAAARLRTGLGAVAFTGSALELPAQHRALAARIALATPTDSEYRSVLRATAREMAGNFGEPVALTRQEEDQLVANLRGLTLLDARKVVTKALVEDGKLSIEDLKAVFAAKKDIIEREGLLEFTAAGEKLGDVAGLKGLKDWLAKRRELLINPEKGRKFGLTFPKGLLLLGVQGCGKSLCARAVAAEWGLPLLRLDPSSLYNKYIGESEKNFQRAMKTAERVAPVVLWIDEIEKAFADAGDQDGGVSQRILGTFLAWLQDRKGDVFVVATANDIKKLPPEFIRKGRFDEIFFVDLPGHAARETILRLHLKKRGWDDAKFDLRTLASAAEGFSGAELEQAVVAGLYAAFAAGAELDQAHLLAEVQATKPLSQTMAEKVSALREWARERTVSAD